MRILCVALLLASACSRIAGIGSEFRATDGGDGDGDIELDVATTGWPTNGGVGPLPCVTAADEDGDGRVDDCDNCPLDINDQMDRDYDGIGDICDPHPDFAVERLAYFNGFNSTLAQAGTKIGTNGTFEITGGLLRQTATTQPRTMFLLAGGPWRQANIELKLVGITLNGTNPYYYAGAYLLQSSNPAAPDPRPDSQNCQSRFGTVPHVKVVRIRSNVEVVADNVDLLSITGVHTQICNAARLGERPAIAGNGDNPPPSELIAKASIAIDSSDVEMAKVALWTYYAKADWAGVAVYETIYP